MDAYTYLGAASLTVQNQFGIDYIENFMGASKMILAGDDAIPAGKIVAIPVSNMVDYYTDPSNSGYARMGLRYTVDSELPMLGFAVEGDYSTATGRTWAVMGHKLWAEYLDAIAVVTVSGAAAKEAAARAILSSLMVKNNNKKVSFFSTDGHCLAYGEKEFSGDEIVGSNDVCIPKIFVDFVLKFVKDTNQEKIKVMFRKDIVSVGLDNLLVFSRLIDGDPLDPDMILSQMSEFRYTTTFEKEKLIEAFKFFSNTNKDTIPVVVKANERNIVLSLQGSSISGRISVEGESVMYKTDEPIEGILKDIESISCIRFQKQGKHYIVK